MFCFQIQTLKCRYAKKADCKQNMYDKIEANVPKFNAANKDWLLPNKNEWNSSWRSKCFSGFTLKLANASNIEHILSRRGWVHALFDRDVSVKMKFSNGNFTLIACSLSLSFSGLPSLSYSIGILLISNRTSAFVLM